MVLIKKKIKVLIIDDSALARDILSKGLSQDAGIEVVGTAPDVYVARDKIISLRPDVLTLDIEMPRMDGVEFLKRLMPQFPLPVVVVSSLTQRGKRITIEALEAGAVDFIPKPSSNVAKGLESMLMELRAKIKIASTANVAFWKGKRPQIQTKTSSNEVKKTLQSSALAESTDKVIAIGASTGGTEAIKKVITAFPINMYGVVVVQHMPPGFTKMFAESLNKFCMMEVKEAQDGDRVMKGRVLIAPGNYQLRVIRSGGVYKVSCRMEDKVNGHCPSVDVLMHSVAEQAGPNSYGILLTGMGSDGAKGLKSMKDMGAMTIGQDESTCVVFGMPKVAYQIGAVDRLLPIDKIAPFLVNYINSN